MLTCSPCCNVHSTDHLTKITAGLLWDECLPNRPIRGVMRGENCRPFCKISSFYNHVDDKNESHFAEVLTLVKIYLTMLSFSRLRPSSLSVLQLVVLRWWSRQASSPFVTKHTIFPLLHWHHPNIMYPMLTKFTFISTFESIAASDIWHWAMYQAA